MAQTERELDLDGSSSECPQSNSVSGYCLGWNSGYYRGEQSREDVEENQNNNNDDDDDDGNREDDGEFVPSQTEPRTIDQTPKRVIGDNN